ncbi:Vacuolar membrane protein [Tolypocladium paradoxum]|uniref:RBR-type E3 ubiquitin transferase n=1 Tax=Tolypocladium paradoxum TaxID=94208 RepID=A0A2S4L136_9HYPO|nr:Vacuolar membrane protein [Tolypocladium paradoxum]
MQLSYFQGAAVMDGVMSGGIQAGNRLLLARRLGDDLEHHGCSGCRLPYLGTRKTWFEFRFVYLDMSHTRVRLFLVCTLQLHRLNCPFRLFLSPLLHPSLFSLPFSLFKGRSLQLLSQPCVDILYHKLAFPTPFRASYPAATMSFDGIDRASLDLILELQLQDAQSLMKGKHREGEAPDAEVAAETYKSELESLASRLSDRAMSRSMARAVRMDSDALRAHADGEQQAIRDRQQALNLGGVPGAAQAGPAPDTDIDETIDDEAMDKLRVLYGHDHSPSDDEEPPSKAAKRTEHSTAGSSSRTRTCVACDANIAFVDVVQCPCSHGYCHDCIVRLFSASISDESLFPPRCCGQAIPLDASRKFLPADLVGRYQAKELEHGTPNRTYCHEPACSTFVPPQFIQRGVATCPRCQVETCVTCKGQSHEYDCPQDEATQELLRVAAENGWQRCHSCHGMVELNAGCYHITCRCGAHFCYLCGVPWKQCACEQWDEARLVDRANNIVDRHIRGREANAAERARLLACERLNLIDHHECMHVGWDRIRGEHRCEECYQEYPHFIYECRNCRILACAVCRFNRL